MVRDHHELGESWSPQYGMVGGLERRHLEDDGLRAVVVPGTEGNGEGDLVRPGAAGLLTRMEYYRVGNSAWLRSTSFCIYQNRSRTSR